MQNLILYLLAGGQPLQEKWVKKIQSIFPNTVFKCLGGLFEYLTGDLYNIPSCLRKLGLEWIIKLLSSPSRFWYRYLVGIPILYMYILQDIVVKICGSIFVQQKNKSCL